MVSFPNAYRWSSYGCNALGEGNSLVTPHATYLSLSRQERERLACYSLFVSEALSEIELREIRSYLQQERAWGSKKFQDHIQVLHGRVATITPLGRPAKAL